MKNIINLENDILDQYNLGKISKKEMKNILKWCEMQRKKLSRQR